MPFDPISVRGCGYSTIECAAASAKNLNQVHIKPSAPIRWIFSTVMGFKMQLFDSSVHSNTALDLVWLSDRQLIFSTPTKRRFSVLFELKGLQIRPISICSSLSGHLSSQETSKQPRCTRCHVRNKFFRTRLLP